METKNICPLTGNSCLFDDCMWFDSDRPRCSVFIIADNLRFLKISAREIEKGLREMKEGDENGTV